jgi:hypothetical protein
MVRCADRAALVTASPIEIGLGHRINVLRFCTRAACFRDVGNRTAIPFAVTTQPLPNCLLASPLPRGMRLRGMESLGPATGAYSRPAESDRSGRERLLVASYISSLLGEHSPALLGRRSVSKSRYVGCRQLSVRALFFCRVGATLTSGEAPGRDAANCRRERVPVRHSAARSGCWTCARNRFKRTAGWIYAPS